MKGNYHEPVLLQESVDALDIKSDGIYVDVTFGGGGHSTEILKRLGPKGQLVAFDQDEDALKNTIPDERFTLINENFRYIRQFLKFYGIGKVKGILADFGVSSHQFDTAERGFSTRMDAELDMRMSKRTSTSAYEVVNEYSQQELRDILREYGELRQADGMARAIVEGRKQQPIKRSSELVAVLERFLPAKRRNKIMAQLFQAVRIEVNQELAAIKEFLLQTPELLESKGRLCVISYHSLEDRLVKRFMKTGKFEGEAERDFYGNPLVPFKTIGKLVVPSAMELERNPRARSAKLRIAERL